MKKIHILLSALSLAAAAPATLSAQNNFQLVEESMSNPDNTPAPVYPVPSDRQLKWNETEFYAFFHYGMNTYTNQEWGTGMERETVFAPTQKPDPKQWLEVAKKAEGRHRRGKASRRLLPLAYSNDRALHAQLFRLRKGCRHPEGLCRRRTRAQHEIRLLCLSVGPVESVLGQERQQRQLYRRVCKARVPASVCRACTVW